MEIRYLVVGFLILFWLPSESRNPDKTRTEQEQVSGFWDNIFIV